MDFSGMEKLDLENWDGKIVCTLFMAGCNFRCPFCHNGPLVLNPSKAPKIPWETIYDYLKRRTPVIDAVCITGGEPTLMPDLYDKIAEIKKLGYLIKLDTNGTRPEIVKLLYEQRLIDYVAMDIKGRGEKYPEICGVDHLDMNDIKETVSYLLNSGVDYEFRTTLIDEFHDVMDFDDIGHLVNGAKRYYLQKYVDREGCIKRGFTEVSKEKAAIIKAVIGKYCQSVQLRGYE